MFDRSLRKVKDGLLKPVARLFAPVHPLVITAFSLAAGIACALVSAAALYWLALLLWLLNRFLDGLDGFVARSFGKQSDLGAYLDLVFDFIVYSLVPLGLAWSIGTAEAWTAAAVLLASYYVNAVSWLALSALLEKRRSRAARGKSREEVEAGKTGGSDGEAEGAETGLIMPRGLVEGTETVALYLCFFLFPASLTALFYLGAALVFVTAAQRIVWSFRGLRGSGTDGKP